MGLICGCPAAAHIADLVNSQCKEGLGQVQKVIFQRIYSTAGTKNAVTMTSVGKLATWTANFSAADGTKMTISPYIQGPTTEAGAARTFGSGNQVLGGMAIIVGREPTTFTGTIYEESQDNIKAMKDYMCEEIGVYLIDENGNIGAQLKDSGAKLYPIPVQSFFVGDKSLGGLEEPDSNVISWSFLPNWSDDFTIVKADDLDFNPLTDLVNTASN